MFAYEIGMSPLPLAADAVKQQQHVAVAYGGAQNTCAPVDM